jgi:methylthioribose-1-phosphate isomerase
MHNGKRLAPEGIGVRNPAFDITPARLVTAIVCETGVVRGDLAAELAKLRPKDVGHGP